MARASSGGDAATPKSGRIAQFRAIFTMTRKADPAVVWWMLLAFLGTLAVGAVLGIVMDKLVYLMILATPLAVLAAMVVMARRAETAAYAQIAGQPGASVAALRSLRKGWVVRQEPVAIDQRTQDLVFRAVGRPGVVLITEGPLPRVIRLAENEKKKINKWLGPEVPVQIMHAGDGEGQVPLRKLSGRLMRLKPVLTKDEVSKVAQRLAPMGGVRPPIPKGIDPMRVRPDRKATRGR